MSGTINVCMYLYLHLLGWAHSLWSFLELKPTGTEPTWLGMRFCHLLSCICCYLKPRKKLSWDWGIVKIKPIQPSWGWALQTCNILGQDNCGPDKNLVWKAILSRNKFWVEKFLIEKISQSGICLAPCASCLHAGMQIRCFWGRLHFCVPNNLINI